MLHSQTSISEPSVLSVRLINASILLYTCWLLLPVMQTTGGAVVGLGCIALFGLGILLDSAYLRLNWFDFLLRVLCAAALPLILWFFLRRGGNNFWGYYVQQGMFWFPVLFCAYARNRGDERLWRFLEGTLLACFLITTLTTIGWLVEGILREGQVYAYSRSLGSGEPGREVYLKELMLRNIGGYDFVYASTLVIPMTCYAIKKHDGLKRLGFLALCVAQVIMIALSQYTYALIFAVALIALELVAGFVRRFSRKALHRPLGVMASFLWALLALFVVFLARVPLVSWGASLCENLGFSNLAYSLSQLLNVLTGSALDSASRIEYYRLPLEGIAQSPWLGSLLGGTRLLSQHSDLLDLLSGVGVVGAVATLSMICRMGRGLLRGISKSDARPQLLLQYVALLLCALLGTVIYSRDIPLILCAGAMLVLEPRCELSKT